MSSIRTCTVCNKSFEPRLRFQVEESAGQVKYFCAQKCQQADMLRGETGTGARCSACATAFTPEYSWQVRVTDGGRQYFCTQGCRQKTPQAVAGASSGPQGPRRIAVFNHKGGTGKTTTAVSIAAGLAEAGKRVLLVDVDPQGNVGVSLGVRGERTLYHVLVLGTDPREAAIPVRDRLDVLTSNESLAAAELYLAGRPHRDRVLRERMLGADAYDFVVLDCSPSLSLLNQNALVYADNVIVPVSCDYLSLVGVKQVIKTLRDVYEHLKHPVQILGVIPTMYDARHKIAREVIETLQQKFGDLCFPPVRVNIKLREAPAARQSIFEYASDSAGAEDYRAVVARVIASTKPVSDKKRRTPSTPVRGIRVTESTPARGVTSSIQQAVDETPPEVR
ncbi:MAG: AAA family ATPase [Deltaproteobacteria bacterium]|nr:AAA family ATPase [Deltaproteobacteria bacterium]